MSDLESPRLPKSDGGLVQRWLWVLATTNPPDGEMDPVSRWLFLTRAGVIPMTLVSALSAGLLAVFYDDPVDGALFALSTVGLVLAHMANNLMNDLFDLQVGTDQEDYPRNLYSPHPVLSGVISKKGFAGDGAGRQRAGPDRHARSSWRPGAGRSPRSPWPGSRSAWDTRLRRCD